MAEVQMRDGSHVEDARLGRLKQYDPRSRNFPITDVVEQRTPRSYSWSCYARLDQGNEGSCVGHAFAHELAARPVVVRGVTHELATDIYHDAQRIDEWAGGAYPGADPFYEGTSVLAGAKTCTTRGFYTAYHWGFTEPDVALAVGYNGPVVIGSDWTQGMMRPDPDGFIHPTGETLGGHAWLLYSIDVKRSFYRMLNSWSRQWGLDGTAKIRREDLAVLLARQGEACLPSRHRKR